MSVVPSNTFSCVWCFSREFHGVSYGCLLSAHESIKQTVKAMKSPRWFISVGCRQRCGFYTKVHTVA